MRSTTVGWLTSMVRVLPVTADQRWPNRVRPDSRESISHPIEPAQNTPRNRPTMRGPTIATRDRADLGGGGRSGLLGMSQGYHSQVVEGIWAHARHSTGVELPLHHVDLGAVLVELHFVHELIDE